MLIIITVKRRKIQNFLFGLKLLPRCLTKEKRNFNLVEIEETFVKGTILGDGIASNKMECVPENELSLSDLADQKPVISKNAKLLFRKSQF